ncbi:MAG: methyltransferase domain-containing protein [Suipraeoptans sp.]
MIKDNWKQILDNINVRQNLSSIRREIKDKSMRKELISLVSGNEENLIKLLDSDDTKTRKNAALLMGDIGDNIYMEPLFTTYENEVKRFVKSSYLNAMGNLDYSNYIDDFKEKLTELQKEEITQENKKHISEEMSELSKLIIWEEGTAKHSFISYKNPFEIILMCNKNHTGIVKEELKQLLPECKARTFGSGVQAKVDNLGWIRDLRTYREILFVIPGVVPCKCVVDSCADMIVKSDLLDLLAKCHDGQEPYYFRIELKTKRTSSEKAKFVKQLSGEIERLTNRSLINTTDNYELELRVIETPSGDCNVLLKLFTLEDIRFSYRDEVIPSSIKPVNAALCASLAKDYLLKDAQVLDPFCGVGTMLIERHKAVPAKTTFGIDINEEAIIKARINTQRANQIIHYVNRDLFTFKHDYLFDEVFTDMPFAMGRETQENIHIIYKRFFEFVPGLLKSGARVIIYTHDRSYINEFAPINGFYIEKIFEISKKEETFLVVMRYDY